MGEEATVGYAQAHPAEPPGDEERSAKKARNHNHMHGDGDAPVVEPARVVAARVRKRVVACVKVAVSRGCVFQGLDRRDGSWGFIVFVEGGDLIFVNISARHPHEPNILVVGTRVEYKERFDVRRCNYEHGTLVFAPRISEMIIHQSGNGCDGLPCNILS